MSPAFTRRSFVAATLAAAGTASASTRSGSARVVACVGTYTPNGHGVHPFVFDPESGTLSPLARPSALRNPAWLCLDARRGLLFAACEVEDGPGGSGSVAAFRIDPRSGALDPLNQASSGGAGPAHISLHPGGRFLFAANYGGGSVAVLPVAQDGRISDPVEVQTLPRATPPAEGADMIGGNFGVSDHSRPHAHMVAADPSGRFVLADDAGSDRICVWRFDAQGGRLLPAAEPFAPTPPGSAPRHFAFHPDGRRLYNLQEHDALVASYRFDPATGALRLMRSDPSLPPGFAGSDLASELAISADGRFLFAANRLRNTITTFAVTAGAIRKTSETWVEADYPRSFGIDPSGRFLICCNQRSDSLTSFRIDPTTGSLRFTGRFTSVGAPASIVFHVLPG